VADDVAYTNLYVTFPDKYDEFTSIFAAAAGRYIGSLAAGLILDLFD
jgi:hypothetical protein